MLEDGAPAPADALLQDGSVATIRPVTGADRAGLTALYDHVSDDSLRLRFFSAGHQNGRHYVDHVLASRSEVLALVAVQEGEILGTASAEVDGDHAEIAFLVADRCHGNGVGTLLLEHLAAWSRERGIVRFTAEVLAENALMLQVFTDAGFSATRKLRSGVVSWELTTAASEAAQAAADERECRAERTSLAPLLYPRSVAVVGVSRHGGIGRAILDSIISHGFTGKVFVIHPAAAEIAGQAAYPTLASVPEHIDVVIVAVPARAVPATITDAAAAGCSSVVVISSGFSELGAAGAEGGELQREILQTARDHSIRLLGPNCLGLLCNDPSICLNATFSPVAPTSGGIAVASQSGGVGIALLDLAAERGLGIQSFLSLGNQSDVSGNDLLAAWYDDPQVQAAAFYLEGFGNAHRFARLARRFSERKPVLAVVGGASAAGARGGSSHTAAATTPSVALEALFAQTGVLSCRDAAEMVRAAHLLTTQPLPRGRCVGIVSNAGGIGILAADAAERHGLVVPELSAELQSALAAVVHGTVGVTNPVDLGAAASADALARAAGVIVASGEVDALMVAIVATSVTDPGPLLAAATTISRDSVDVPVVLVTMGGLGRAGDPTVPVFATPGEAAEALRHAATYAEWRSLPHSTWGEVDEDRAIRSREIATGLLGAGCSTWLDPEAQEALLGGYGIHPFGDTVRGALAAGRAAERTGYPVAVKVADANVVHKTDRGLVRVGLRSTAEVRAAVRGFEAELERRDVAVLVQPMATGVELALGVSRHPVFGPVVMVAAGGVSTDLLADRAFVVPPLVRRDAARALRSLRIWPLLNGYRGATVLDTDALEDLILALGDLARDVPELAELDLNPVMATPTGPVIVDIKARLEASAEASGALPRQLARADRRPSEHRPSTPQGARVDAGVGTKDP